MNQPIRLRLFGALHVQQGERLITRFRTQQTGALLAYLAYYSRRSHPREALIELFWPDRASEAGRHNLSNALSSLRSQLEPPGVAAGSVLRADRTVVGLNAEAIVTDVEEFEQALRQATPSHSTPHDSQQLARAVDRYTDPLLPHYYDAWIVPEQERLLQGVQQACRELISLFEQEGEREQALRYARRSLALDPWREESHLNVMRLLKAAGQPEEALRQYRVLERLYTEELGTAPSSNALHLAQQIREQVVVRPLSSLPASPQNTPPARPQLLAPSLPSGTLTCLIADIHSAAVLSEKSESAFRAAQATAQALVRAEFRRYGGQTVPEAESFCMGLFPSASDALSCAVACRKAMVEQPCPDALSGFDICMALYTGDVEVEDETYAGRPSLHGVRQILAAGHDGQTLLSEATAAIVRRDLPAGVHLRDLGQWQLTEGEEPERLFQVVERHGVLREFPSLNATPVHTTRLPLQFTRFFGREREIEQIAERLQSLDTRLLTLAGPGGTGKTRLAIEAVDTAAETLQRQIWFVPLADIADSSLLLETIRDSIGISRLAAADAQEQVCTELRKRPTLLLLDNFEQLVEGGAEIVHALLEFVPSLMVLVTSRQLLNVPGEQEFAVTPLPTPNSSDSPQQLSLFASVQLFVDRAQASKPDFRVTNSNAALIAELCDRLEGLPLAIELAAARALALTPVQMLAQLGRRFEFLVTRKRGIAGRQRTLRATVDWSYCLLSPELRRLFAQLSVFRGGWTVEAAEAVCNEPLALDLLAQLCECSLLTTAESSTEIRFRMLETLREFAWEQLSVTERTAVQQRHRDYYTGLIEAGKPKLWKEQQALELERWEREHDNLRAALQWCLTQGAAGVEAGFRLVWTLSDFWQRRGYLSEAQRWMSGILTICEGEMWKVERAKVLNLMGVLALVQGDSMRGRTLVEESLSLWRGLEERSGMTLPLNNLALLARLHEDFAVARALYEESLTIYRAQGDRRETAVVLLQMGLTAAAQGDRAQAQEFYEEGQAIHRELKGRQNTDKLLGGLAELAVALGDPVAGQTYREAILAMHRKSGHRAGIAACLDILGDLAVAQRDYATGRTHYEEALAINREIGYRAWEALNLNSLGQVAIKEGDYASAWAHCAESLTIYRELAHPTGIATVLEGFASLAAAQEQPQRAALLGGAAQQRREECGVPLLPESRKAVEEQQEAVRAALGETAFLAAWTEGRAMSSPEAVVSALQENPKLVKKETSGLIVKIGEERRDFKKF